MNNKILTVIFSSLLLVSCASIPKETIILSKTIGSDLQILHDSHRNMVQLYYNRIKLNVIRSSTMCMLHSLFIMFWKQS